MTDFLPLIAPETTPGNARFRRVTEAELAAYAGVLLGWLPNDSVVARIAGQTVAVTLPGNTVLGRTETGDIAAMDREDLDELLDMGKRLAGKAGVAHVHQLADLPELLALLEAQTTDDIPEGAINRYAHSGSVRGAGAVMYDERFDVVSVPLLGAAFPAVPVPGEQFYRTDLLESFVYQAAYGPGAVNVWLSETEQTIVQRVTGTGLGTGAGAYLIGNGASGGIWIPVEAMVTRFAATNETSDSGTVELRSAPDGGSVAVLATETFTAEKRSSTLAVNRSLPTADQLSIHASGFTTGLANPYFTISYRTAFVV